MCTFFTNGRDVAGRLVAAHLADPAAAQRREAAKHTPNSDTGPPSFPRAAAPPRTGEPPPSSYSLAPPPLPFAAVARGVTGQSPCGVAAAAGFSSDLDLVGRRRSFPARSAAVAQIGGDMEVVRRRRGRTAPATADLALTHVGLIRCATDLNRRRRGTAPGLDLQHEDVWGAGPRLGGGGLLLRRSWSAGWLCSHGHAVTGGLAGRRRRNLAGGSGKVLSGSRGGGPGGWRPVKLGLPAAA